MRYDRARGSLDRHATYIVAAYLAGAARLELSGNELRLAGPQRPGGGPPDARSADTLDATRA